MYRDCRNIDVLMFFEHKDRELEVIVAIAKILKQKYGLSVAIASITFHKLNSLFCVRPKVVVFPSNNPLMNVFYAMYGEQVEYINMNWEQMLSPLNKDAKRSKGQFMKDILKHCAWGNIFREYLISSGVKSSNIRITGKPLVTILKKKALRVNDIKEIGRAHV